MTSKSELKRKATTDPLWAAERLALLEAVLRAAISYKYAQDQYGETGVLHPDHHTKWVALGRAIKAADGESK